MSMHDHWPIRSLIVILLSLHSCDKWWWLVHRNMWYRVCPADPCTLKTSAPWLASNIVTNRVTGCSSDINTACCSREQKSFFCFRACTVLTFIIMHWSITHLHPKFSNLIFNETLKHNKSLTFVWAAERNQRFEMGLFEQVQYVWALNNL